MAIFVAIRRYTIFVLGVWIMGSALVDPESENTISMLVIGMIMIGILPIEDLFGIRFKRVDRDKE